jgi:hypothetical protein
VVLCFDTPLGEEDVMDFGVRLAAVIFRGSISAVCGVASTGLRMAGRLHAHY